MSMCLRGMVEELLMKRKGINGKDDGNLSQGLSKLSIKKDSYQYLKRDGTSQPINLPKSVTTDNFINCSNQTRMRRVSILSYLVCNFQLFSKAQSNLNFLSISHNLSTELSGCDHLWPTTLLMVLVTTIYRLYDRRKKLFSKLLLIYYNLENCNTSITTKSHSLASRLHFSSVSPAFSSSFGFN